MIKDAEEIEIEALPDGFCSLPEKHFRCKNFQFAYQMFEVGKVDLSSREPQHRLRKRWRDIAGIEHDATGCMLDPEADTHRRAS